ncbi:uncharacterized protein Z520_02612 [Fonsecaea multimorphosa CBS 102226]|uniref:Uncharacterized protein n=1 Tax=Fonsecaea multimorphosa CBS 102226 TaxID=1442371 RepID=A0A0D2K8T8_9EURO|nr:uncharacterized protein Z520_02612 [Fonsecaea multimorphosa CBS 102226]KIY02473.1 hypothetical protein Z520_02612 [Fonsecaea multimorphosa CBS 102226]OAL29112.1 hypothetical protein AYO22_02549 [Fonsecaea multimorphosa]
MENRPTTSRPASSSETETRSNSPPRSRSSMNKLEPPPPTPAYDASALLIQPSPLLTSSLHSRNSATSAQESAYLRRAKWLRWTRAVLAILSTATATAAVGCEGHVLHRYNSTHMGSKWHLPPLWPTDVDVRPTLAILISATLILLLSLSYLIVSLIPTPYSRTLLYNVLFFASSLAGVILSIFAIPFNSLLTNPTSHHHRDSIQSWTCKFSHSASQFMTDAHSLQIPVYVTNGIPIPAGFKRLCMESEVSQGLIAGLLALEAVSMGVAVVGILLERSMTNRRMQRYAEQNERQAAYSDKR